MSNRTLLAWLLVGLVAASLVAGCAGQSAAAADSDSPRTRAIQNKGSDTMVNLALAWAEAYRNVKPDVDIAVTGGGSGTGIAALINGTVDIANASRAMKESEIADAQDERHRPCRTYGGRRRLAVIVNKQNPVSQLTIDQLSDIFTGRITNWKEVGGDDAPIVLVSRETNSGTHVYFLEEVVRKGDSENKDVFAPQTLLMPSSVGITSEVQRNPHAIGYDGLGYVDPATETTDRRGQGRKLARTWCPRWRRAPTAPTRSRVHSICTQQASPDSNIDDYLAWIQGPEGQQIVANLGFVPIPQE